MSRIVLLTAVILGALGSAARAEDPWLFQGVIVPKINLTLRIHSPQTVSEVVADVGDNVKKGDALIRFDDRHARIEVQIAEVAMQKATVELKRQGARMDAAKAMVEKSGFERDRIRKLVPKQAASPDDLRVVEADLKRLAAEVAAVEAETQLGRLEVESAKAVLAAKQLKLDALTVRAPFDGLVVSRSVTPGELVARPDQPLLEIMAGPYLVETSLPDQLVPTLKPGSAVYIETDKEFGDKTYKGTINLISPVLDPRTRSVKVRIALPPEATTALHVGLMVKVHNQAPKDPKQPKE